MWSLLLSTGWEEETEPRNEAETELPVGGKPGQCNDLKTREENTMCEGRTSDQLCQPLLKVKKDEGQELTTGELPKKGAYRFRYHNMLKAFFFPIFFIVGEGQRWAGLRDKDKGRYRSMMSDSTGFSRVCCSLLLHNKSPQA